jgi:hypothetical protein
VGSGNFGYRAFMGRIARVITEEMGHRAIRERRSSAKVGDIGPYKALAYHAEAPTPSPKPFSAFEAFQKKQSLLQQQDVIQSQDWVARRLVARFRNLAAEFAPRLQVGGATGSLHAFVRLLDQAQEQIEGMSRARDVWMPPGRDLAMVDDPQVVEALQQHLPGHLDALADIGRRVPAGFIHMYAEVKHSLPISYRARLATAFRLRRLVGTAARSLASRVLPYMSPRTLDRLRALIRRAG